MANDSHEVPKSDVQKAGCAATIKRRMVESPAEQRRRRAATPQPWLVKKIAVFMCYGLIIWCYYVYIGRVCVPMIRLDDNRRGSRATGIVLLVIFNILFVLLLYAYTNIILTPPGYAKKYVQQSPSPEPPFPQQSSFQAGPPFQVNNRYIPGVIDAARTIHANERNLSASSTRDALALARRSMSDDTLHISAPDDVSLPKNVASTVATHPSTVAGGEEAVSQSPEDAIADRSTVQGALGPGPANLLRSAVSAKPDSKGAEGETRRSIAQSEHSYLHFPPPAELSVPLVPAPPQAYQSNDKNEKTGHRILQREVPLSAPLHPYARYCTRCEIIRPPRAHHCRVCGQCVINMDHHCPWIGHCVGAHNHVHFVSFCIWATVSLGYVAISLAVLTAAPGIRPWPGLDGQILAVCIIGFILSTFTGSMAVTHIGLILLNQSTIESMAISDMRHRETAALQKEYGMLALRQKKRLVKEWDVEWGKLNTEANLWWLGKKSLNWKAAMGSSAWKWLLPPPGYRPDSGMAYQTNPRRGPDGQWRRRTEWPKDLQ